MIGAVEDPPEFGRKNPKPSRSLVDVRIGGCLICLGDVVLQKIREQWFECRVIVISAVDPDEQSMIPSDEYLEKPVFKEELHEAIESQLGHA